MYKLITLFNIINKVFEKILILKLFVLIKNRIFFPRAQIKVRKKNKINGPRIINRTNIYNLKTKYA